MNEKFERTEINLCVDGVHTAAQLYLVTLG